MSADYSELLATASQAIRDNGRPLTLRKVTTGAYDASTGAPATTNADTACYGLETSYKASAIDGTRIQSGDVRMLLEASALAAEPAAGDILLDGAQERRIVNVDRVKPGTLTVLYIAQVRG